MSIFSNYEVKKDEIIKGVFSIEVVNINTAHAVTFNYKQIENCIQFSNIVMEGKGNGLKEKAVEEILKIFKESGKHTILIEVNSNHKFIDRYLRKEKLKIIEDTPSMIRATTK